MNLTPMVVVAVAEAVGGSSVTLQSENLVAGMEMFAVDKENSVVDIDYVAMIRLVLVVVDQLV